jgi:hypothetical protein
MIFNGATTETQAHAEENDKITRIFIGKEI